jgi:hypothetical protein
VVEPLFVRPLNGGRIVEDVMEADMRDCAKLRGRPITTSGTQAITIVM